MNNELAPGNVGLTLVVCATVGPVMQLTSGLVCQTELNSCPHVRHLEAYFSFRKVLLGSS